VHALSNFDNSDGSLLFMPQTFTQDFAGGGTDTAIAMDQVNSLVSNGTATGDYVSDNATGSFDHNSLGDSANGGTATETNGPISSDASWTDTATAGVNSTLDAFTQSIVLGANIQYNNFNTTIAGHDSITAGGDVHSGHSS